MSTVPELIPQNGSFIDKYLIRKKQVSYDDFNEILKEQVILSGEVSINDLDDYFKSRLRLSGDINFLDFDFPTKDVLARKGSIYYEDLAKPLQDKFIFKNITEQELSPELAFKINNKFTGDYAIIDCGIFDQTDPTETIDGGDW